MQLKRFLQHFEKDFVGFWGNMKEFFTNIVTCNIELNLNILTPYKSTFCFSSYRVEVLSFKAVLIKKYSSYFLDR